MTSQTPIAATTISVEKFTDPDITAKGEQRASVGLDRLETLWFNTGSLCNIACVNCYIESSPDNDRLAYLTAAEVTAFLDEIIADEMGAREIGFTGGEPFLNPEIAEMLDAALVRGFEVLVLSNAMQPMQRPRLKKDLLALKERYGSQLRIRVSLDHYTAELHEAERGGTTFAKTLAGLDWLAFNGFEVAIAGRTCWHELDEEARAGYGDLIRAHRWPIDPEDAKALVLLPEMDGRFDVPEITTACWDILGKKPSDMMCATSRMIVKRKGASRPIVLPCTLLPYDLHFEMGETLAAAAVADGGMFSQGEIKLCHPHCAKFCVLGGGSCS